MSDTSPLILLSAGGTGGHMFPAAALAQDLIARGYRVELVTDTRGTTFTRIFGDMPVHVIRSGTLGAGLAGKIKGVAALLYGVVQAQGLVKKLKPALVVGFGGYPSVPAVYAAQQRGIPTILHEQNAILGKANDMMAHKANHIALSMPRTDALNDDIAARAVFTGNPVRAEISALYDVPYIPAQTDGALNILVLGGSLGASVFSEVLPKAFARLAPDYKARLNITQQCREADLDATRKAYDEAGIKAGLATFFDNIPALLAQAHLVIARSGASTVSEVTMAGRPAIFVPYPHHKDQQQKINADAVADAGGAWVMTQSGFTEDALLSRIENFLHTPETLTRAATAARICAKPDAAAKLGDLVESVVVNRKL